MTAVLVRIILRWLAGALVTYGVLTTDLADIVASDPDIAAALEQGLVVLAGILAGVLAEAWYWLARRYGWAT